MPKINFRYKKPGYFGRVSRTNKALKPCGLLFSERLAVQMCSNLFMIIYRDRLVLQALGETFLRSHFPFQGGYPQYPRSEFPQARRRGRQMR